MHRNLTGTVVFGLLLVFLPAAVPASAATAASAAAADDEPHDGEALYRQHCAGCHEGAVQKAPHRLMLGLMTADAVHHSLKQGVMQAQGRPLSEAQRVAVAEYIAGEPMGSGARAELRACAAAAPDFDLHRPPALHNWGLAPGNTRHIPAAIAGITAEDLDGLTVSTAIALPGANRVRSQPALAGGLLFVGSHTGRVYALQPESGCVRWQYQAAGEVRTGIVVEPWERGDAVRPRLFFGDVLGNLYGLDAASGAPLWRRRVDDHPNATITGTPSWHDGRLYVPVSSLEVSLAVDPGYECCTFRGAVAAYDAGTGEALWKRFTIDEPAAPRGRNAAGTQMWGPSGAVVWNSPAIDAARGQLYVGTGENMSSPATASSDALFAIALADGAVRWVFQATANDAWNTACGTETDASCPEEDGPDFDFGAATVLVADADGRELLVGGQKSGLVHALDPATGELRWQTRVGRGGIQGGIHFGMAAADGRLYVPISDMPDGRDYPHPARPGLHALDLATGEALWYAPATDVCNGRRFCHPGISQAITAVGGLVFAGAMDGVLRVHDGASGELLWQFDSTGAFETVQGTRAQGGSFGGGAGPVVYDGAVYLSSGYGIYNHMPGNLLLRLTKAPTGD